MADFSPEQKIINKVASDYLEQTGDVLDFSNIYIIYKPESKTERINIPLTKEGVLNIEVVPNEIRGELERALSILLELVIITRNSDRMLGCSKGRLCHNHIQISWIIIPGISVEQKIINRLSDKEYKE